MLPEPPHVIEVVPLLVVSCKVEPVAVKYRSTPAASVPPTMIGTTPEPTVMLVFLATSGSSVTRPMLNTSTPADLLKR